MGSTETFSRLRSIRRSRLKKPFIKLILKEIEGPNQGYLLSPLPFVLTRTTPEIARIPPNKERTVGTSPSHSHATKIASAGLRERNLTPLQTGTGAGNK